MATDEQIDAIAREIVEWFEEYGGGESATVHIAAILRAHLSGAGQQGDGWRDIASAPRDGTTFLAGWAGRAWTHPARWQNGVLTAAEGDGEELDQFHDAPTHWRSQPAPPVAPVTAEGDS